VLAYDEATGATAPYPVTAVHAHPDPLITTVTIDGEAIETTPDHPFATQGRGWVPAADLHAGEAVWRRDGSSGTVEAVSHTQRPQVMYHLTVDTAHTYFVGDGLWVVHNVCNRPGGYQVYDVDRHGNLSPGANRAPGHKHRATDNLIESHHPIQNEWAEANVTGYRRDDAPAVLLPSSSGMSHAQVSAAQRDAARVRVNKGLPPWTSTTIREEFDFGYRTLIDAGVPPDVARRAIRRAYKYFDSLGAFQ